MTTLAEKMANWESLKLQLDEVEDEIKREVLALGSTQKVGRVEAKYKKSSTNGKYDYEGMCREVEPDVELIQEHTIYPEPYIDFKKLAEACGVSEEIKKKHYQPPANGAPTVTVILV